MSPRGRCVSASPRRRSPSDIGSAAGPTAFSRGILVIVMVGVASRESLAFALDWRPSALRDCPADTRYRPAEMASCRPARSTALVKRSERTVGAHLEADGQAVVPRRFVSKRASWPVDAVYDCGTWQPSDEPGSGLDSDDWRLGSWH